MRAKILNASAGSGKTYQLAYKYVRDVIDQPGLYRHILAVTFTNKATEEMKSRILKEIHRLASGGASPYLGNLCRELSLDERSVRKRAAEVRSKILHDYSRFTVLTIDTFFQRILRAFIKELGIDLNYNVEIETASVLSKGADTLIEQLHPQGVIVVLEAEHLCMSMRGVKKPGAKTVTNAMRGIFKEDAATRAEALSLLMGR